MIIHTIPNQLTVNVLSDVDVSAIVGQRQPGSVHVPPCHSARIGGRGGSDLGVVMDGVYYS